MSARPPGGSQRTRLIFDFHLIILFLPLSTQCPEKQTKGGWGMGPLGSMEGSAGSPPQHSGRPWSPRLLPCVGLREGEGRRVIPAGREGLTLQAGSASSTG